MNYYLMRSRALQDIAEMKTDNMREEKIIYIIALRYGFSPRVIKSLIEIVEGARE